MQKKISVIIISVVLVVCLCVSIQASESLLRWDNVFQLIGGNIAFDETSGSYCIEVVGNADVTKITATVTLYYQIDSGRWVEVPKDWTYEVSSDRLEIDETFNGVSGRRYRAVLSATVSNGENDESITRASSIVTCP